MKFQSSIKLTSNERDKKAILDKIAHGWDSRVTLPLFHSLPFEGNANVEYIFLKGLGDFIIIPNDEPKTIKTSMRIAPPGIVIENGTINGEQLRIPWESMIKSEVRGRNIYLTLDKNQTIIFAGFPFLRKEKFALDFMSKVINEEIKGSQS